MMLPDIDAYCRRIGYDGSRDASAETLRRLHEMHPASIPFENIDVLLKRGVRIDLPSIEQKLVRGSRGGYCYEHNLLFMAVLRAFGFAVRGLAAKVTWMQPPDTMRPRTHMLLEVEIGGETWIADVGFGGLTMSAPLRLVPDVEQATPHEAFRIVARGVEFFVEARIVGEWRALYRFDRTEQFQPDYEVSNWYVSTSPASHFTTELMAARVLPGRRLALANRQFTEHRLDGHGERRVLNADGELLAVLNEEFGIQLPEGDGTATMLAAVKRPPLAAAS